jgi:fatty acid synthase subunit beta
MQHGDKCDIWAGEGSQWFAKSKKGACVFVLKAFKLKFSRTLAGQIPTGWEAGRYGMPEDMIAQTDSATLWALGIIILQSFKPPSTIYTFFYHFMSVISVQ